MSTVAHTQPFHNTCNLLSRLLSGQIAVEVAWTMSAHAYSEDQLVEQHAIGLFIALDGSMS